MQRISGVDTCSTLDENFACTKFILIYFVTSTLEVRSEKNDHCIHACARTTHQSYCELIYEFLKSNKDYFLTIYI